MKPPPLGAGERRLLLACARAELTEPLARQVAEMLARPLDWETLLFYARLHSVGPLLHRHVMASDARTHVPAHGRRGLLALAHRAAYQNRLFAAEHELIVDALAARGVPVLVQKGMTVAQRAYRNLSLRPLIDLIYLVPRSSLRMAAAQLSRLGYARTPLSPIDAIYRWSCPQLVYEGGRAIETAVILQWQLVSWPRAHVLAMDGIWKRAVRHAVAGREVLVLSPVDQILYLCLQADDHGYFNRVAPRSLDAQQLLFAPWSNNRLVRFTDIHETIRHHERELDWELFVERARASGLAGAAATSLALTGALLGQAAPSAVLERLGEPERYQLRRFAFDRLAGREGRSAGPLTRVFGAFWLRRRASTQIRLARLIGLSELALPRRRALRPHGSATLARSVAEWWLSVVRRARRPSPERSRPGRLHL